MSAVLNLVSMEGFLRLREAEHVLAPIKKKTVLAQSGPYLLLFSERGRGPTDYLGLESKKKTFKEPLLYIFS